MDTRHRVTLLFVFVLTFMVLTGGSYAIPAFSRQYGTSCSTCHVDFPKLNDFGKAFKDAGFKFPKDDETFIKVPPVMLGAPAQKELWPHTIFPGTIPGMPQIGLRFNQFFQYTSGNANNYYQVPLGTSPGAALSPTIPRTDFEAGFFSIFMAGNFGSDIAFWVDDDLSVSGLNANGALGDGYLRFVNLGRFFKLPTDAFTVRVGQFELDLPFTQARSINISPYDIYTEANIGSSSQNVNNQFSMQDAAQGIEFSGGHQYGGYHYSLAIVNKNTSGGATSPATNVSSPAGFFSDSNYKDIYARVSYRFNLEKDPASRHDIQAAGATGPRDHTYLSLGSFYYEGRSVQRFSSETASVLTAREPFYRVGGDFSFNYRAFNLFGLYMYGHDQDQVLNPTLSGFVPGSAAKFNGGFLEADYLALPWLMAIMRYDRVQSSGDFLNEAGSSNYYSPVGSTRDRVTPGVQFLIHANIKASFEYQFRPQQALTYDQNGKPLNPFRTNTATGALEFVY
ncbi:MAG TPA: hypothetical protein VE957_15725 [Terriglobales bacterium]|nr:hypothetical protein [Terriglobales bacterium]